MSKIIFPSQYLVACHTDNVGPGTIFVAVPGKKEDGILYIPLALEKGAIKIVVQHDVVLTQELLDLITRKGVVLERVVDARKALALLSAQAYGYPAKKLHIIGITGTKGKTTTTYILAHILRASGYKTAMLSTVENMIGDTVFTAKLTTQHPDYLHTFFALCVQNGVTHVVMEVAAQAMTLHRVAGLEFSGLLFTNFEREHSEFYASIEEYFAAKCALFDLRKSGVPVLINADDVWGQKILVQNQDFICFGLVNDSCAVTAQVDDVRAGVHATISVVDLHGQRQTASVCAPTLVGRFNAYNVVGAIGLAVKLGLSIEKATVALRSFGSVPGRLQGYMLPNGARSFIDYAHTPSSFTQVLSALRETTDHLIVVFGAGGDRDAHKRPVMGDIVSRFADVVVVTSDNPRSERAEDIAQQIIAGIPQERRQKLVCELDREQAIKKAYALSRSTSVIVLLGKGPDEYQIIGSVKYPFSEKAILKSL
ncbi:UDP-N-acetylmuramoyl-L-alanyl-D-glutamate--2,6-diaminopimelate ligase [Candidatus Dependentiae bacterium HGW-Dependentiae-1]|nr:MAG: UDP-N-acetylmuramoyl-L-alanyl-D-glutamate--2,6-diaminopimelate ligase [Candidatus Dependentiae bacterium HGW-Dependentiae-1]